MGKRKTIYLGDSVSEVLAMKLSPEGSGNASLVVDQVCEAYLAVIRRSIPVLSENEWWLILDAVNGTHLEPNSFEQVTVSIEDAVRYENLADKWSVNEADLLARVHAWNPGERLAVLDLAMRYWARDRNVDGPIDIVCWVNAQRRPGART